jgi:hypothetical protein
LISRNVRVKDYRILPQIAKREADQYGSPAYTNRKEKKDIRRLKRNYFNESGNKP